MRYFEVEGSSPQKILDQFIIEQGTSTDYVKISEIVDAGSGGFLGIGRRAAKVKIEFDDYRYLSRKARLYLSDILSNGGFDDYNIEVINNPPKCTLNITSASVALLTGKQAATLDSLQYLVDRLTRSDVGSVVRVLVDVDNYRDKFIKPLKEKAIQLAHQVKRSGKPITMQPMSTIARREIHNAVKQLGGVTTFSEGDGQLKPLTIKLYDRSEGNNRRPPRRGNKGNS
ncbi:protein jag [Deferribacterales bacterium RsTz2092]|nr:DNA/RNA-binding protein [Deferribacterales bacterium]